jgi:hypothetical protein
MYAARNVVPAISSALESVGQHAQEHQLAAARRDLDIERIGVARPELYSVAYLNANVQA